MNIREDRLQIENLKLKCKENYDTVRYIWADSISIGIQLWRNIQADFTYCINHAEQVRNGYVCNVYKFIFHTQKTNEKDHNAVQYIMDSELGCIILITFSTE